MAVAGAALVLLRPGLVNATPRTRAALAAGFLVIAAAAFLNGSVLANDPQAPAVIVLRGAGIVLLGVGTLSWRVDQLSRRVLWTALVLMAMAEVASAAGAETLAGWFRAGGAFGLGAVILTSGRRSIATRVATSSASTLLVVVLAVSVALSVVIASNVQREALRRLDARARTEAEQIDSARRDAVKSARLAALSLAGPREDLLLSLSGQAQFDETVEGDLTRLSRAGLLLSSGPLMYVTDRKSVVAAVDASQADAVVLAGSRAVTEIVDGRSDNASSVEVVGGKALAVGAFQVRVRAPDGLRFVGVVVATTALDDAYLGLRAQSDPDLSLALVDRNRVLSRFAQERLPEREVLAVGRAALAERTKASTVAGGRFLAARPVLAPDASAVLAVVSATPTTLVDTTRNELFRTLFLVALVTALLAFLVALLVGERIGAGLRRLTVAARAIQGGDLGVRAAVASRDEVGVLGATFDSMAGSIESLAAELRQRAADEAQLRSRMEAVVGGVGEALVATDDEGRITTFNPAAERLLSVTSSEAIGQPVESVLSVRDEQGEDLSHLLSHPPEQAWSQQAVVHHPGGTRIPVALSAGAVRDSSGRPAGAVFVLRDMRREREVERMKTEFLSNISHELNTPLTPIKGFAEMLRAHPMPPEQAREFLGVILDSADRLERRIDQLIAFAALEAGRLHLRRETVALGEVVESVVERWRGRVDDRHSIVRRVSADLPEVEGDRRLLERCLDALLDNAVKYSPEGGRVLATARRCGNGQAPAVELTVRDHGVGIPEDQMARIFEGFTQVDASATRSFEGFGLGLAFVNRIVHAHGGELSCKSTLGEGSTFSIVLPAKEGERS